MMASARVAAAPAFAPRGCRASLPNAFQFPNGAVDWVFRGRLINSELRRLEWGNIGSTHCIEDGYRFWI